MFQIVPAILATSEKEYKDKIENLWDSNIFDRDWIQIDLMDGKFVKNKSIEAEVVTKYPASFKYEAHLMVDNPYSWANQLQGFSKILRFIVPIELDKVKLDSFISFVRAFTDAEIGFSFEPETPLSKFGRYQEVAEAILIMGVHSGFSGQEFIPDTPKKIEEAASLAKKNGLDYLIGVDGGINNENIKPIKDAGADYVVVGSYLFRGDIDENLEKLWVELSARKGKLNG